MWAFVDQVHYCLWGKSFLPSAFMGWYPSGATQRTAKNSLEKSAENGPQHITQCCGRTGRGPLGGSTLTSLRLLKKAELGTTEHLLGPTGELVVRAHLQEGHQTHSDAWMQHPLADKENSPRVPWELNCLRKTRGHWVVTNVLKKWSNNHNLSKREIIRVLAFMQTL